MEHECKLNKNHLEGYSQDYSFNPVSTVSGARNADCSITTTCRCTGTLTSGIWSSFWIALLSYELLLLSSAGSNVHLKSADPLVASLEMLSMLMWYQDLTGGSKCQPAVRWATGCPWRQKDPKGSKADTGWQSMLEVGRWLLQWKDSEGKSSNLPRNILRD